MNKLKDMTGNNEPKQSPREYFEAMFWWFLFISTGSLFFANESSWFFFLATFIVWLLSKFF